jgi:hypothetical protein
VTVDELIDFEVAVGMVDVERGCVLCEMHLRRLLFGRSVDGDGYPADCPHRRPAGVGR